MPTIEVELINTEECLPPYGDDVLFRYPEHGGFWAIGWLIKGRDQFGDYFKERGSGTWYIIDGHTVWANLPANPSIPKRSK